MTNTLRLGAALLMTSGAASARDLTLVTHRHADWTELYISAAAPTLFDAFSVPYSTLTGESDQVDFGELRAGTGWLGDVFLEQAQITIGSTDAGFEGMSVMFHPVEDKLPMTTPLEGMIAIGICNGPPDGTFVAMAGLHSYVGYFSSIGSEEDPIRIAFHQPLTDAITVTVHDHKSNGEVASYEVDLAPGAPLILPASSPPSKLTAVVPSAGAIFGAIGMLSVLVGANARADRT